MASPKKNENSNKKNINLKGNSVDKILYISIQIKKKYYIRFKKKKSPLQAHFS